MTTKEKSFADLEHVLITMTESGAIKWHPHKERSNEYMTTNINGCKVMIALSTNGIVIGVPQVTKSIFGKFRIYLNYKYPHVGFSSDLQRAVLDQQQLQYNNAKDERKRNLIDKATNMILQ